jgi:hypothetical protein
MQAKDVQQELFLLLQNDNLLHCLKDNLQLFLPALLLQDYDAGS